MVLCAVCMTVFASFTKAAAENINAITEMAEEPAIVLVVHITTTAESKADFLKAFDAVQAGTRQEAGNLYYDLYDHTDNPLKFTLLEGWKSQQAIDFHNNTDHFKTFVNAIDGKADLQIYTVTKRK